MGMETASIHKRHVRRQKVCHEAICHWFDRAQHQVFQGFANTMFWHALLAACTLLCHLENNEGPFVS